MDGEIDPYNVKLLAKGDKEKKIKESLHKEVLDVRCGKIKLSKGKKNSKILKIDHPTSPAAIKAWRTFVYLGVVESDAFSEASDIVALYTLSYYNNSEHLTQCVYQRIQELDTGTVAKIMCQAVDQRLNTLERVCVVRLLENYIDFISNKDMIYIIGIEKFQMMVTYFHQPPQKVPLSIPTDTYIEDMVKLNESGTIINFMFHGKKKSARK